MRKPAQAYGENEMGSIEVYQALQAEFPGLESKTQLAKAIGVGNSYVCRLAKGSGGGLKVAGLLAKRDVKHTHLYAQAKADDKASRKQAEKKRRKTLEASNGIVNLSTLPRSLQAFVGYVS